MKYDKWQIEIIEDTSKYILLCKGRQIGGTTAFAKKAAKWMAEQGKTILVGSITEEQAKLVIVMVKECLREYYPNSIATKKADKPTLDKVVLRNGGWIRSRAVGTMGDAFKGFTADVNWFNEMSKWPELAFIAIMPTLLTKGGEMWGDSTPFGKFINGTTKKTFFFKCFENLDGRWKVYYKTSPDAIIGRELTGEWTKEAKNASLKFLEDQEATMDKLQYAQEYLGQFMDEVNQWFPDELIQSCINTNRPNRITKGQNYYLGVDIARMGEDESSFEIIDFQGDHLFHTENQITKKTTLSDTTHHIEGLHSLYDFSKIFIDDEGIGVGVLDFLLDAENDCRNVTIGINNSKQIIDKDGRGKKLQKTLLYSNLKMLMETNKVHLLDDPNVFQSLKSVQFAYTNDSLGTRHLKIFGNYTHIAEGLVRAAWCVKYKDLNPTIHTIKI